MKHLRALELFFLKAKEEFDRRMTKGGEVEGVRINYFGCDLRDDKVVLRGQRVVHGGARPMVLPENHDWMEGVEVFEAIMKDLIE